MVAMDLSGLSEAETEVDKLRLMLKNRPFWVKLMNVQGVFSNEVKNGEVFVTAHKLLKSFTRRLISEKLKCKDIKKLLNVEKDNVTGCITDLLCSVEQSKRREITKAWQSSKKLITEAERYLSVALKIVHHLDRANTQDLYLNIPDTKWAQICLERKQQKLIFDDLPLSELSDGTFLSPLDDEVFSKRIFELLDSQVFLTVCRDLVNMAIEHPPDDLKSVCPEESLSKLFGEDSDPEDNDHRHDQFPTSILSVLKVLNSKGIDKYEAAWQQFFSGDDCDISEVKIILVIPSLETEIKCAEQILKKKLPTWIRDAMKMYTEYGIYEEKVLIVKKIMSILNTDENVDVNFCKAVGSFYALKKHTSHGITLKQLSETKEQLSYIHKIIVGDFFGVLKELSKASSLVDFLRETVEEDLRQLIDSVEEHSEQFIQESTISALIDVRRFVSPILKLTNNSRVQVILKTLERSANVNQITSLALKINECNANIHSLRSLYKCCSNKGELIKDIAKKIVKQKGTKFIIHLKESGICDLRLQYKKQGIKTIGSKAELEDMRSRALLLVNTETKRQKNCKQKAQLQKDLNLFIDALDNVMCIADWFEKLAQCGHPDYVSRIHKETYSRSDLKAEIEHLEQIFEEWTMILDENRKKYYWLNCFYPEQLFKIKNCLKDGSYSEEVATLFEYGGCGTGCLDKVRTSFETIAEWQDDSSNSLHLVGQTLEVALKDVQFEPKCFEMDSGETMECQRNISDVVQKGQLFVAALEENSKQVIPTVLAVYRNTSGFLPMPHQILFCHNDTKWEHLYLLLQRCFLSQEQMLKMQLFCIVGVEKLINEVQFKLVDELKKMLQYSRAYLAITCEGSTHHPFLDHFDSYVHHVQPMTPRAIESCFRQLWPNIVTITSELPGQGKTELIHDMADDLDMGVCSFHISGDIDMKELIVRMSKLKLMPHDVLHIDIGVVSKPSDLDLLLFQLIVLGFLVDGSSLYKLPTQHISIEIANSINNVLRNSLLTTMYFYRKHLKWENFENFKIREEICSPVQVVCCYLNSREQELLDNDDLYFSGQNIVKCSSPQKCRNLLKQIFSTSTDLSFSVVNIFLNVLADQLKKLSSSLFFRSSNLRAMLGGKDKSIVKSTLINSLLDFSTEFSTRSVQVCREDQILNVSQIDPDLFKESFYSCVSAMSMTRRVESMIQWAESNHLIIAFHNSDIQTLSALYRDKELVPEHIKDLFERQVGKQLPDFSSLDQEELQEILKRVARSKPGELPQETVAKLGHDYALTPDNLLKIILIILRIKAHVPVIIMGETGCGKTSLIRYLATICDVDLQVQNMHAGTNKSTIIKSVMDANAKARSNLEEPVWMFLDEINTCDHLGMINNILCHHRCQDVFLAPNLVLMAACNPYKLRNEDSMLTAGLTMKIKTDERSKLVYRVNPLPETMVDFVWDYGNLTYEDEKEYIHRMVGDIVTDNFVSLLVELLVMSQNFIKVTVNNESSVSLRDVSRCKRLISWFKDTLNYKNPVLDKKKCEINSIILALAHSYHSRLVKTDERLHYREEMVELFMEHDVTELTSPDDILDIIDNEQNDILDRMHLPQGTARNTALRENVFVIMVCILNRIPIFVVGKPGCSKSLSLQLIKSNLRGKDSEDKYFQSLPQLYFVSYQGSESSTSDGIIKVFDKAKRYREHNQESDVLPVVILDEIGLAEVSRFNPLKVLHSLLEPGDSEVPDVAVVGISNWALDAAKMNRAIHLSRPDMDVEELYRTGKSISEGSKSDDNLSKSLLSLSESQLISCSQSLDPVLLRAIAYAYQSYIEKQKFLNFHGLRDYYSLVKYVSKEFSKLKAHQKDPIHEGNIVLRGLLRNFGGLPSEVNSVVEVYKEELVSVSMNYDNLHQGKEDIDIVSLIKENINDFGARHLLLSTFGDSALSIIENVLQDMDREYELITGSQFEEDLTDDYNYRILSRIILCMEQGIVLILKDLDSIYGSLYDMLNQNYTIVGRKKNCRIAHGAYSNPLCHVDDKFRCIVLVEESKLYQSDRPFLNRFEKQNVCLANILTVKGSKLVKEMDTWLNKITSVMGVSFSESDFVPIFTSDMLASLVHHILTTENDTVQTDQGDNDLSKMLTKCKDILLQICTPDGIIRMEKSIFAQDNNWERQELKEKYFNLPLHAGLAFYIQHVLQNQSDECLKLMVFTHSNIHTDMEACLKLVSTQCQIESLSSFKSEKQLSKRIGHFWKDSDHEWLIIQCSAYQDIKNFLLMKSIVEKHRTEFVHSKAKYMKHVVIIIHLEREVRNITFGCVNFLSSWQLAFVDKVDICPRPVMSLLDKTMEEVIKEQRPLISFITRYLFWAFTCIGYSNGYRTVAHLRDIIDRLLSNEELLGLLEELTVQFVNEKASSETSNGNWQLDVVCNTYKLFKASTLHGALEQEIDDYLKPSLAALVYQLELKNAWDVFVDAADKKEVLRVWKQFAFNPNIVNITDIPPPAGPQCYHCPILITSFQYPFVCHFLQKIAGLKDLFLETLRSFQLDFPDNDDDATFKCVQNKMCNHFRGIIQSVAKELFQCEYLQVGSQVDDYFNDFCRYIAAMVKTFMSFEQKHQVIVLMMKPLLSLTDVTFVEAVTEIHVIYWMHESYLMSSLNLMDACLQVIDTSFEAMLKACFSKDDENNGCETDFEYGADKADKHIEDDANKGQDYGNTEETSATKHRLVNYCCKLLIPSLKVSSTFCVDKWLRSVSLVLSLSSEISLEPKSIQYLRICSDFATLIIIPYNLPSDTLLELGENLLMQGLDSEDLLCYIFSLLCDLRQILKNAEKDLQHFLTCYLSSCLSANPNSQILAWTFKELKTNLFEQLFCFFGPTLHQALAMEVSAGLDILNDNQCENNEFIQIVNDFLEAGSETQEGSSVLAALVIDVLHHFILNEIDLLDGGDENNSAVVSKTLRCQEIISVEDKLNFKRLAAIAFLKSVITSLSCVIKSKNVEFKQTSYWQQMCNIFHLCQNEDEGCSINRAIESMQKMLLRTLVEGEGLKGFDEVRQACTDMPEFLHDIDFDLEHRIQTVEHNPWAQHDEKENIAFYSLSSSTTGMCSLMECVDENPEVLIKMCSFVIQQQFLKQIVSPLADTEKSLSKSFIQCAKDCSISQQIIHLLECLCASKDFDYPLLHISSSTGNENFSMVSVLVHLFSIITVQKASGSTSVLSRCLVNPVELDQVYIYSCPDEGAAEALDTLKLENTDMVSFINCSCNFVSAIKDNRGNQNTKCSVCQCQFPDGHRKSKTISIQDTYDARYGYTCFENDFVKNPLNSIRRLSPVAFRLLQFLIYGSFVGSLALQNNTIDLATVLKLDDAGQVIDNLTEQLKIHWKALKILTLFGDAQLCKFLHHVLDNQKRLLFENPSPFLNKQERDDFEREFDENVVLLMKDRFDIVQKIVITNSETVGDNPAVEFEKTLNEIPDDHGDSKHLTRLFRITRPPTMENMEIEFLNAKMGSSFPFLGLVFEKKVMLDMLSHLLPLVQWHLCTVRYFRNRIKKAECNKTTLDKFIYNLEQSGNKDSEKALINTHDKFRESWNILINHIPFLQRYNSDIGKMERIHKDSNLSESLVMDDTSPLFQVMTALQNMHNEFLDDAVIISLCMKCHSISFLKKSTNTSILPCINLEDLTEKEVIPNPLDEDLLKFSQCNTNPGCGLQRDYDFYQIEMQVADTCLINKPYLKIQATFPHVIFSGEILQMSRKVFDEIRENVPQMPLEKDLEKSVLRLKEENPCNLQGLLNYLEMAFRLLTQNPIIQQDDPQNISQLLKEWQSLISVQIPAVTTFCSKVHLCYIIGLYEFVEELMADYVVDSLEEKYRKPIPDECIDQLNGVAKHANIELLDTLICVLKRFAFRYLSTSYRDASDKLSPYLMDSTLWPTGIVQKVTSGETNMDAGMLSPYLAVEHIVEVIQFFKNALQEKKQKVNSARASFVSQPKEQPSQFLRQKTAQRFRKK